MYIGVGRQQLVYQAGFVKRKMTLHFQFFYLNSLQLSIRTLNLGCRYSQDDKGHPFFQIILYLDWHLIQAFGPEHRPYSCNTKSFILSSLLFASKYNRRLFTISRIIEQVVKSWWGFRKLKYYYTQTKMVVKRN